METADWLRPTMSPAAGWEAPCLRDAEKAAEQVRIDRAWNIHEIGIADTNHPHDAFVGPGYGGSTRQAERQPQERQMARLNKAMVISTAAAVVIATGLCIGSAFAAQPQMEGALRGLETAQGELQKVTPE